MAIFEINEKNKPILKGEGLLFYFSNALSIKFCSRFEIFILFVLFFAPLFYGQIKVL